MTETEREELVGRVKDAYAQVAKQEDRLNESVWEEIEIARRYEAGQAMRKLLIEILEAKDIEAKLRVLVNALGI